MGLSQTDKIIILNQSATLAGYILNPKILCEYIGASFNINSNILQVEGLPKKSSHEYKAISPQLHSLDSTHRYSLRVESRLCSSGEIALYIQVYDAMTFKKPSLNAFE